jgi:hypothetical protein
MGRTDRLIARDRLASDQGGQNPAGRARRHKGDPAQLRDQGRIHHRITPDANAPPSDRQGAAFVQAHWIGSPTWRSLYHPTRTTTSCRHPTPRRGACNAPAYRANSGHCAVSDGVKMAAPWATHIASDLQSVRLTDPRRGLRYTLDSLLLRTPPGSTGWVFVKPIPRNRSTELCAR